MTTDLPHLSKQNAQGTVPMSTIYSCKRCREPFTSGVTLIFEDRDNLFICDNCFFETKIAVKTILERFDSWSNDALIITCRARNIFALAPDAPEVVALKQELAQLRNHGNKTNMRGHQPDRKFLSLALAVCRAAGVLDDTYEEAAPSGSVQPPTSSFPDMSDEALIAECRARRIACISFDDPAVVAYEQATKRYAELTSGIPTIPDTLPEMLKITDAWTSWDTALERIHTKLGITTARVTHRDVR